VVALCRSEGADILKRSRFWLSGLVVLLCAASWIGAKQYRCYRLDRAYDHRLAELKQGAEATLIQGASRETVEEFFRSKHLQYEFRKPSRWDKEPNGTELVGYGFEVVKVCDSLVCNGDVHVGIRTSFDSKGLVSKDVRPTFTCL